MNKTLVLFVACFLGLTSLFAQDWHTDFAKAKEMASSEHKSIVLVFQGSDWCAPCMKLDREIWSTDVFKEYAADHYVMLQADFPRRKANALSEEQTKANAALAEEYNTQGIFPFVVLMDSNGKVLGETGYKKTTPDLYIKELNAFIQ
ncbi:thioredoxin family protein [Cryomorphaceae bacterium 1068]|nr:thioredoxin family protein [Cryomorphaceae bacterium 1068]